MSVPLNHIVALTDLVFVYGQDLSCKTHANHGIKIVVGEKTLSVNQDRKIYKATGLIVKSNTVHKITPSAGWTVSIFLNPETEIGHGINSLFRKGTVLTLENETASHLFNLFNHSIENHVTETEIKRQLVKTLHGTDSIANYQALDKRIELVISHIRSTPGIKFSELLYLSSLSESRLIHLFKKEIGITIRKYVLWCRTQTALKAMASGSSIKHSAHVAGFTDAAHLNRTFISMHGLTPSKMIK